MSAFRVLLTFALLLLTLISPALAQGPERIAEIRIHGNHTTPDTDILALSGLTTGVEATPDEILELCERLNPDRVPGRLTLIARMGAEKVFDLLPPILRAVRDSGQPVLWASDPMHANVFTTESGFKTRRTSLSAFGRSGMEQSVHVVTTVSIE